MSMKLIGRRIEDKDGRLLDADAFIEERAGEYGLSLEELIAPDNRSHITEARRRIALALMGEGLRQCEVAVLFRMTSKAINKYKSWNGGRT
jgi:hypothetical protein